LASAAVASLVLLMVLLWPRPPATGPLDSKGAYETALILFLGPPAALVAGLLGGLITPAGAPARLYQALVQDGDTWTRVHGHSPTDLHHRVLLPAAREVSVGPGYVTVRGDRALHILPAGAAVADLLHTAHPPAPFGELDVTLHAAWVPAPVSMREAWGFMAFALVLAAIVALLVRLDVQGPFMVLLMVLALGTALRGLAQGIQHAVSRRRRVLWERIWIAGTSLHLQREGRPGEVIAMSEIASVTVDRSMIRLRTTRGRREIGRGLGLPTPELERLAARLRG